MNEFENTSNNEIEIDLSRLFKALWRHAVVLLLAAVLGAALLFSYAYFLITPKYTATATMYVNNGSGSSSTVTSSDLTASQNLVDTYIAILRTRLTMEQAIEQTGVSYTYEELYDMVKADSVDETELFTISVTSSDPAEAALLANTLAELLPERIASLIEGTSAYIADYAVTPTEKSSPNVTRYTLIGLLAGLLIAAAVVVIRELTNDEIQRDEELLQLHPEVPILASIPDLKAQGSGGYGYGEKPEGEKKRKKGAAEAEGGQDMVGEQLTFAAREAYKKLRTNLTLSLPDSGKCKVIGMTSSLAAEGKSTTSVNLASSLAESGRRVLLLEADMRKPSQATRLGLERTPGLSNLLTGSCTMAEASQKTALNDNLCVITAGDIPGGPGGGGCAGRGAGGATPPARAASSRAIRADRPSLEASSVSSHRRMRHSSASVR